MKGLVFDIRSFSVHDGPGIRTTVFLKGCPLQCHWCHNPESRLMETTTVSRTHKLGEACVELTENIGKLMSVDEVIGRVAADAPFFEESGGGLTISGGEPLMQAAFTKALLEEAQARGIATAVDTSGFAARESVEMVLPHNRLFLYDLKLADSTQHLRYTGKPNALILENLHWLSALGATLIIRIPLVENITDTEENLSGLRAILASLKGVIRIDLLPYHHTARHKYERMSMVYPLKGMNAYDRNKAEHIKSTFLHLAPIVSIDG